ncbi:MAG: WbqC family protein [Bacteroidales bacterium]|jgi:hypothetical protein|uniref:WbqC family protein n=1 Tax=Sodaliphilus pleomorphus TaxID=2606626 RepID=UPI0024098B12|nr:WbqC family protein [Sodaliphilus pleomorphus]MCI5980351.1 WbqC family protein [Muribaculaceae bacterium]MDD6688132.1 WbqC family protein [Sodaliphilus pleomorphus]MDY6252334.1 WbqC family protein [Bacteroidales bacterium]MDY6258869.1 WbqC family protein [Bacteroidales bacterium]
MTRLLLHKPIVMGSTTAGSVRCYAAMLAAGRVYIDPLERHLPLRHSHHRYLVEGPNGVQKLTVALTAGTNAMPVPMQEVTISEHGNWRHLHWGALYSAYGKSPYFDYIAPELKAVIDGGQRSLLELNTQLQQLIIDFLDLPIHIVTTPITPAILAQSTDLRGRLGGKKPDGLPIANVPYYQLWATRFGFQPGLSILDLLMNCGREAVYTLRDMVQQQGAAAQ